MNFNSKLYSWVADQVRIERRQSSSQDNREPPAKDPAVREDYKDYPGGQGISRRAKVAGSWKRPMILTLD